MSNSVRRVELAEVLRRRRMVRSFSGRPPGPGALEQMLAAAQRAPSAGNTDAIDVLLLEQDDDRARFWQATTTADWRERSRRWEGLSRAPVVACFFVRPRAYLERYGEPDKAPSGLGLSEQPSGSEGGGSTVGWPVPYWFFDSGCAVLAMLLAAVDAGLGACFLGNFRGEQELRGAFDIPSDRRYLGAVLVGEPGGDDPPSISVGRKKRAGPQRVHRGHW
jgi:nitroreductase